jgi:hypothetical protein
MLKLDVYFVNDLCVAIQLRDFLGDMLTQPVSYVHLMSLDDNVLGHASLL